MRKIIHSMLAGMTVVGLLCGAAQADNQTCIGQGLNFNSAVDSQHYGDSAVIFTDDNFQSTITMEAYRLELKPLRANKLSELQLRTTNNLSSGAGYSSPYLWEVGRGPGLRGPANYPGTLPARR